MVKGWNSKSSWGFPKGKINKDEKESECAIREVRKIDVLLIFRYLKKLASIFGATLKKKMQLN